jgi:DNA-directed RNA polymerase omega subunit
MEGLLGKTGSTYKLVLLASRRAIELNSGAGRLVEASPATKCSIVALEEIIQGKVKLKEQEKE